MRSPCDQCPWRKSNQGTRHKFGFYRKDNLTRLWNALRRGGAGQSCHPTDPRHPDHVACGAKPGSKPQECIGAVILIMRELEQIDEIRKKAGDKVIEPKHIDQYLATRKKGLTRKGLHYWMIARVMLGHVPFGEGPLPEADHKDKRIALPVHLEG